MKIFLTVFLFLLLHAGISFAQETEIPRQIFTTVEQMPEFPGGKAAMNKFLAKNIKYPKKAYENNIEGRVVVQFVVETDGRITHAKIEQSLSPDCDEETLRVINKMPKWSAGRQNGVAAACYYSLPVSFKLR